MGRVKDWMIEQEMLAEHGAKIEFACPNPSCGSWIEQFCDIPAPDFMAEKQSDITQTDIVEIFCGNCDAEYSGTITNDSAFVTFDLENFPDLDVDFEVPDQYYDPFEDYQPPEDPFSVAIEALGHLKSMIGSPSPANDVQFMNRLIFAGAISLFEAYLADTLINAVRKSVAARSALIGNNKLFGGIKFSAAEIVADPDVVSKRLVRELKDILFHNLDVVTKLYRDALSFELFPTEELRDLLFRAILLRHDCVHRNGQDKDGNMHEAFDNEYVSKVVLALEKEVKHVEAQVNESGAM